MNSIALNLNNILNDTQAGYLLSDLGKRLFFPKGIVAQSAEASEKANKYNATAGMAFNKKKPMILSGLGKHINMDTTDYITYAPTPGLKELRNIWKEQIVLKNPALKDVHFSLPMVVPGLTSGISNAADMFLNVDDNLVIPDLFWDNYDLIFGVRKEVNIKTFTFFKDNKIDTDSLKDILLKSAKNNKVSLLLNFPNNPTGYSPTVTEAKEIAKVIKDVAESGVKICVITDDAYFGLFYEDDIYQSSIFSLLADIHENVLAIKVDGATKEDYSWGLRVGFITFAGKGLNKNHTDALEEKLMGSIRSSFSSSSKLSQYLVIKSLQDDTYVSEKVEFENIMKERYLKVKEILKKRTNGLKLKETPFNSGYFMNFKTPKGFNERLRLELLNLGIGTISLGDTNLRIAYSSVDIDNLEDLFQIIFTCSDTLQ